MDIVNYGFRKNYKEKHKWDKIYGKCPCGSGWRLYKNKTTNVEFLGCFNFPKCKNTKNITK